MIRYIDEMQGTLSQTGVCFCGITDILCVISDWTLMVNFAVSFGK